MLISIGVVALNEEKYLPQLLEDFKKQTYDHSKIEILLVDGGSTDKTREIMEDFKKDNDFYVVHVLDNPKKIQSAGWNVVFKHFIGEAIVRIDAHSSITPNFIENNVKCLENGEHICGGIRPNLIDNTSNWKKTLLCAESSMFGSSIATYRREAKQEYVKSLFHACYKREVIETVGGFNEKLGRTEDNEFHYRVRQAGYKICMNPNILSYQYARPTLKGMLKQKYGNGYWIGLTLGVCPGCLSIYHFVPFAFICGIIFTTLLSLCGIPQLAFLMWGGYGLLTIVMTIFAFMSKDSNPLLIALPFLFLALHLSYGIGTVKGLIDMPKRRQECLGCSSVQEIKTILQSKK